MLRALTTALLFLLTAACAPARPAAPAVPPLRVLVYNIHAGKDAAGAHNLERVAQLVRDSDASLVLLQEVDRGTERSGREDQLATLQRLTGMHGAFGRTLYYQGGEYGIAVLSRWPIVADTLVPLPVQPPQARAGGSYEPRGALRATIQSPMGAIHLLNTHLDASRDDAYRVQEVAAVRRMADSLRALGGVVLVGGDFNAEPGTRVIDHMTTGGWTDAWATCGEGDGLTYPADRPIKRIDYLFLASPGRCRSAGVPATQTSDHRPLLVAM